jgi:hypothetical protein
MTPSERAEYERLLVADIDRMTALAWQSGNLTYKLHSGQRQIWQALNDATAQEALLFISRQWGKSYLSACYGLSYCLRNPNIIVRIAAPTLKQAKDIVSDNLGPICADAPEGLITPMKSDYRWKVGNSELRLGVLERANVDSLRGGNANLVICEEGGFVSSDDYDYALRSVIGPQLLRSGGQLIHVTTPSEEPDHYIHTEVYPRCAIAGTKFEFDVYTNPQLTEEQITKAKVLAGGEESAAWRREYLVQIVRDGSSLSVCRSSTKPSTSLQIVRQNTQCGDISLTLAASVTKLSAFYAAGTLRRHAWKYTTNVIMNRTLKQTPLSKPCVTWANPTRCASLTWMHQVRCLWTLDTNISLSVCYLTRMTSKQALTWCAWRSIKAKSSSTNAVSS